ncbi:hypothetical protein XELAEV_18028321mg, partial [Xenopus laevis]
PFKKYISSMASSRSQNRHALACKFCLRIQESLSVHLRRSCKKGAKPEEIDRLVSEARVNMRQILKGLSVVEYDELDCKESDPQDFFVQFLERNGCYIRGKPVQPTRKEEANSAPLHGNKEILEASSKLPWITYDLPLTPE